MNECGTEMSKLRQTSALELVLILPHTGECACMSLTLWLLFFENFQMYPIYTLRFL